MLCPSGTWSNSTGLGDIGSCSPCPAGTWSTAEGATALESCHLALKKYDKYERDC